MIGFTGRSAVVVTVSLLLILGTIPSPVLGADDWPDSEAKAVSPGETHSGTISTSDDSDRLKIPVDKGDTLTVNLTKEARRDTRVDLSWPGGSDELSGESTDSLSRKITAEETGYVYLEIWNWDFDEGGSTTWSLSTTLNAGADAWNDANSEDVETGTSISGSITSPDDTERVKVPIDAGETLSFTLAKEARRDTRVDLSWPGGSDELGGESTDSLSRNVTAEETGYVYLEIWNWDFYEGGSTTWSLGIDVPPSTNSGPTASFDHSPTSPTVNETITFNASESTDSDGSIATYEWDFDGDGIVDTTGETVAHSFSDSGEYTVELTVTDEDGATATTNQTITVDEESSNPPTGSRSIERSDLTPGESTGVTLTINATADTNRIAVVETFEPEVGTISNIQATVDGTGSVIYAKGNASRIDVLVDNLGADSTVTVTYKVAVPENASIGAEYAIDGRIISPVGNVSISTTTITVTAQQSGLAAYAGADGIIQTGELQTIITDWVFGQITTEQLQKAITAWVLGTPV